MGPFKEGWTESDVEEAFSRGDPDELLYIPITVGMNADCVDRSWAEKLCVLLALHQNFQVRANSATGLGHIARLCGELDLAVAGPAMARLLKDSDSRVRASAKAAACDIHRYAGVVVEGYDPAYTDEYLQSVVAAVEVLKQRADEQH